MIKTIQETQNALFDLAPFVPSNLRDEFREMAMAPIPKAAYQISQLIYHHRADLSVEAIKIGRELIQFVAFELGWAGFPALGQQQLKYMDKALGEQGFDDLEEAEAPAADPYAGVRIENPTETQPEI